VHRLGLKLLGVMMWKLLIIEPFFNEKEEKLKLKKMLESGGNS
jgi:capsule polysaccharide export protein KpsC/LpsZ